MASQIETVSIHPWLGRVVFKTTPKSTHKTTLKQPLKLTLKNHLPIPTQTNLLPPNQPYHTNPSPTPNLTT